MLYFFAFVVLVTVGFGVNHIMLRLLKRKQEVSRVSNDQDDLLTVEAKEALTKDAESLKSVVTELTEHITARIQELSEKETDLKNLIAAADERIARLTAAQIAPVTFTQINTRGSGQDAQRIEEMRQRGMNSTEIARSLGLGIGEVELRLGLLNKFDKS